jgi:hypothetical protein
MALLASSIVNWSALWKIVVAAFAGGAWVVIAFGFLLHGLSRARASGNPVGRAANWALSGLAGAFCVGAVVLGVYAMASKPASKKPPSKTSKSAAVAAPAPRRHA